MENIVGVTGYLRNIVIERGGDPERECLRVFFTKDGKPYFRTENGECWRCYNFITGAHACQSIDDPKTFFNAAKAFGTFQCLLADYPSSTLHETIPNFHNTRSRFADFKRQSATTSRVARRACRKRSTLFSRVRVTRAFSSICSTTASCR